MTCRTRLPRLSALATALAAVVLAPLAGCGDGSTGPVAVGAPGGEMAFVSFGMPDRVERPEHADVYVLGADGREVAYLRRDSVGGAERVGRYAVSAAGGVPRVVVESLPGGLSAVLSSDARRVAFGGRVPIRPGATNVALFVAAAEPATAPVPPAVVLERLPCRDNMVSGETCFAGVVSIAWAPDGSRVAFSANYYGTVYRSLGEGAELYVVNADGSGLRWLDIPVRAPKHLAWSPDGARLAMSDGGTVFGPGKVSRGEHRNLYVVDADGGNLRRVTETPAEGFLWDVHPAWSPDGRRLAFARYRTNADWPWVPLGLFVVDVDGTGLRQVARTPGGAADLVWAPSSP